jgi:hypothetical protein
VSNAGERCTNLAEDGKDLCPHHLVQRNRSIGSILGKALPVVGFIMVAILRGKGKKV